MSNLKQGTLSFASAKRKHTILHGKSQQKTRFAEKAKHKRADTLPDEAKASEVHEISSEDESASAVPVIVPSKRTRSRVKERSSPGTVSQAPVQPSQPEQQKSSLEDVEREHLDVEDKAGRYHRYYNEVRSKMGYIPPVHSEGQNKIHQMLRFFDMSYEFGPCIGMTRLERWERAEAFGLSPPVEVRNILQTKEGIEMSEYAQCVLNTEV